MRRTARLLAAAGIVAALAGAPLSGAGAQTSGNWPTYLDNGARTGYNIAETVIKSATAPDLTQLWADTAGGAVSAEPIQDAAELGDHVKQGSIEALEGVVRQTGEQLACESAVAVNECLGCGVSPFGEGDQCRAAVGGMPFAGDEPGVHQAVDQGGDGAGRDVQIGGQRGLGARSALLELPHKVRPGFGQALAGEAVGHVPAEQHCQFEYPVQGCFPLFAAHMITLTHDELDSLSAQLSICPAGAQIRQADGRRA